MTHRIRKTERTIGLRHNGGVLVGYDVDGGFVLGLPIDTEQPITWAKSGVTSADLARLRAAYDEMHAEEPEFTLANVAPKTKPRPVENVAASQRVLFAGMDCLSGQKDLFETDGGFDR
ncbi:MAG TPA: hypothetical protein VGX76_12370 [Pirellulales bacterium]|jgi:hypothetical protein|nr:hypothetical protein [Pirellulales bacterium]